jgi:hypothetical protein
MANQFPEHIQEGIDKLGWKVEERDGIFYISGAVPLRVPEHIELPWDDDLLPRRKMGTAQPETPLLE